MDGLAPARSRTSRAERRILIHSGVAAQVDALVEQGGDTADCIPGSWWPGWIDWLAPHSGPQLNVRKKLGDAEFTPIEEALGSYVKRKGLIGPVLRPGRG